VTCRREPNPFINRIGRSRMHGADARTDAIICYLISLSMLIAFYDDGLLRLIPLFMLILGLRATYNACAYYAWAHGYAAAFHDQVDGRFIVIHDHDLDQPCPLDDQQ
jgi:hypothetical protein